MSLRVRHGLFARYTAIAFVSHRFGRRSAIGGPLESGWFAWKAGKLSEGGMLVFVVEEREVVFVFFHRATVFEGAASLPLHDDAGKNRNRKADEDKKADALEGFEEEVVKRCEIHGVSFREGRRAYAA